MNVAPAWDNLLSAANELAQLLAARRERIVLAESCTCGLTAAALGTIPGISASLCGSAVTYREATKSSWLGINPNLLQTETAVSAAVTALMAQHVLTRTPESHWAAAVTGYLGPDAPSERDGLIFIAVAERQATEIAIVHAASERLDTTGRVPRQFAAALRVLRAAQDTIQSSQART